jgi:hypothetical protein
MQANSTKTAIRRSFGHLSSLVFALVFISSGAFGAEKTHNAEKGLQVQAQTSQSSSQQSVDSEARYSGENESRDIRAGSYQDWLDNNPRYSHPVHEMVHRNSWSEQVRRNRERASQAQRPGQDQGQQLGDYEEPRVITPDDITYDPNNWDKFYPYPRSRVIWYNERYYSGRYYQDPNQKERQSDRGAAQERMESLEGEPFQSQARETESQYKDESVGTSDSPTRSRVERDTNRIDEPVEGVSTEPENQTPQVKHE